jgi:hypothetical protein
LKLLTKSSASFIGLSWLNTSERFFGLYFSVQRIVIRRYVLEDLRNHSHMSHPKANSIKGDFMYGSKKRKMRIMKERLWMEHHSYIILSKNIGENCS